MERECTNCRFYLPDDPEGNHGHCHLEGPRMPSKERPLLWPPVQKTDFCGKFEHKQKTGEAGTEAPIEFGDDPEGKTLGGDDDDDATTDLSAIG